MAHDNKPGLCDYQVMGNEPLMSVREVAELFNVSLNTVRTLISSGELPAFKLGQQLRLFRRDVDLWLQEQVVESGTPPRGVSRDAGSPPPPSSW